MAFLGPEEVSKLQRRITWLNANIFEDRKIDREANAAVSGLGLARALTLLKDVEEKAEQVANPSGYLKAAAARESGPAFAAPQARQGYGAPGGDGKIHRRATWLNANVFQERQIDAEAIAAMGTLPPQRAMELFKDVEEKKDQVQNPSGYIKAAVKREAPSFAPIRGAGPPVVAPYAAMQRPRGPRAAPMALPYQGQAEEKIQRRAAWLNDKVFTDRPIDDEAVAMMGSLSIARAMELFKEVEEKQLQVKNPSGYLKTACANDAAGAGAAGAGGAGGAGGAPGPMDESKIHRRATWLNANVFPDRQIDEEAIQALMSLSVPRAMELCKDVEEKQQQVRNPSGYLKMAVARESGNGAPKAVFQAAHQSNVPAGEEDSKIHRRITWLNANVFPDRQIDDEARGAMLGMGIARAFELLKDVEEKAASMRNPTGWLKTAALREGLVPPGSAHRGPAQVHGEDDKIRRRAGWLSANVFPDRPIDDEAIAAMGSLGSARAMELFKDIEEKSASLRNPSGYLKAAAQREPDAGRRHFPAVLAPQAVGGDEMGKLHRRTTWLNHNVFQHAPLDGEAIEALGSMPLARAFDMLKDLESKGAEVKNPSGYVKASVKREHAGLGPSSVKRAPSQMGPPAKRR
ncbi:unnamed protein product [Effrenium voratum]|nr:unnamed protein product [Effrenium voratum]